MVLSWHKLLLLILLVQPESNADAKVVFWGYTDSSSNLLELGLYIFTNYRVRLLSLGVVCFQIKLDAGRICQRTFSAHDR